MLASRWRLRATARRGWTEPPKIPGQLQPANGNRLRPTARRRFRKAHAGVTTDHASKPIQELGEDESYTLEVTPSGAKLHAANSARRAARFANISSTRLDHAGWICCCRPSASRISRVSLARVDDRFGAPFHSLDVLKRNLDGMEAVKMNVFHWHLSDNQGFRVESHKFPKLQENGLRRALLHAG